MWFLYLVCLHYRLQLLIYIEELSLCFWYAAELIVAESFSYALEFTLKVFY